MKKHIRKLGAAVMILVFSLTCFSCRFRSIKAFKESPFYTGQDVSVTKEESFGKLHPEVYPLTDGSEYLYWMDSKGFIAYITAKDPEKQVYPEKEAVGYGAAEAAADAEAWFDKVFYKEENLFGREKKVTASEYNGESYNIGIDLLAGEVQTGNSAMISIAADGRLIVGTFVKSRWMEEELGQEVAISPDAAVELAKKAIEEDKGNWYENPEQVVYHWDRIFNVKTECFTDLKTRFWEIQFEVPVDGWSKFETWNRFFSVTIDADSGECKEIAYGK